MTEPRRTPLLDDHRDLGAKLTEFGGWEMPLQYSGIVAEHNAVRGAAGVFDVSHLGKLRLTGTEAGRALQHAVTADVIALEVGRASYALALTDDAGCIDDLFVYRIAEDEWLVVPNAANVFAVADAIREAGAEPVDEWDRWAILALQGPSSFEIFDKSWPDSGALDLKLHEWTRVDLFGEQALVARTGYTGERGFEIYAPAPVASRTFQTLLDAGVEPVGLGARDTLRLEMGYSLYGHEITLETNPIEAGLGWAVSWNADFRGRPALEKVKDQGPQRKLFGIKCTDRGVPRQGYPVILAEDQIGEIVSGNYSPTLGTGIALAFAPVDRAPSEGDAVEIEARGRRIKGDIVKPPFVKQKPKPTS